MSSGQPSEKALRRQFGADFFAYAALDGPPLLFFLLFCIALPFNWKVWPFALISAIISATVTLYLATFRITIDHNILSYRHLLQVTRSVRLSDIKLAKIDVRLLFTPAKRPPYALFIELATGGPPIVINLKLLSRDDIRVILDFLGDKLEKTQGPKSLIKRLTQHPG
jgi:hypothetical protein